MVSPAPPGEAPPGEVWGGAAWGGSGRVFASGGCRIIKCGLIVDLIKGRTDALGGGISARSFSPRLVGRSGEAPSGEAPSGEAPSGEAGGDWA